MRLLTVSIGRVVVAGLVLFLLLAIILVGFFPSRATVVALVYGLPLALLIVLRRRVARTGPVWRRDWGTTLAMWLTPTVIMLVVCGGVESMIALTTIVLPWEPPIEMACLCSRQGGLFAAVDVGAGAAGFAVFNWAILIGLDLCALTLIAILRGERPQAAP
jgi:hypothetical protein